MKEDFTPEMMQRKYHAYRLHIRYVIFFCLLVCLFIILVAPCHVSDEAFQNFSFAATITSIVLAVVSIVYSFYSSGGLTMSIGEMKQVEKELKEEIRNIPDLKNHVSQTVDDLKDNILKALDENRQASDSKTEKILETVHNEMVKYRSNSGKENDEKPKSDDQMKSERFDYFTNSIIGNLLIYTLYKSWTTKTPFNILSIAKIISFNGADYLQGFLVALTTGTGMFKYDNDDSFTTITVKELDATYFSLGDITNKILESTDKDSVKKDYKTKMDAIDDFFNPNKPCQDTTEGNNSKG